MGIGFAAAMAGLALSVQAVGALAVVGGVSADSSDPTDAHSPRSSPVLVAFGDCVKIHVVNIPGCLPFNCHCIEWPGCSC